MIKIERETEKAYLFTDGDRVTWCPKSACPDGVLSVDEFNERYRQNQSQKVSVKVKIERETDRAILINVTMPVSVWIPKSQYDASNQSVPKWLIDKKIKECSTTDKGTEDNYSSEMDNIPF